MTLRHRCFLVALFLLGGTRIAEAQCTATVTPTSVSVPSIGSTSALSVITGTNCSWTAVSSVGWITITGGATGSGLGQVNYTVAANPDTGTRVGTALVAGVTVTFTQGVGSCSYSVTPTSVSVPSIGSTSALSVTTGTSCSWTATSSVSWITITSGGSGSGLGAINYVVAANTTGVPRTGTITVAGLTVTFSQTTGSCSYNVIPTTVTAPLTGNLFTLSVTTGTSCSWTASTTTSWITITAGATGSGIGSVSFQVPATTTGRTGTLLVAGVTVTVTQGQPGPAAPTNLRIIADGQ